jgi:hypothetical protein
VPHTCSWMGSQDITILEWQRKTKRKLSLSNLKEPFAIK